MRIIDTDLTPYGFERLDEVWKKSQGFWEGDVLWYYHGWVYTLGHSRRGQFYYLIVDNGELLVYASDPDGSGASVELGDVLFKLYRDGLVVDEPR